MLLQRILLAVVALAAAGWLVVSLVGARALDRATDVSKERNASPAALAQAVRDAERARDLRPADNKPDVVRAQLLAFERRPGEALKLFEDVTRREPDNVEAWFSVALLSVRTDPAQFRRARDQMRRLDPLGAPY